jgi:hypothetical protein
VTEDASVFDAHLMKLDPSLEKHQQIVTVLRAVDSMQLLGIIDPTFRVLISGHVNGAHPRVLEQLTERQHPKDS